MPACSASAYASASAARFFLRRAKNAFCQSAPSSPLSSSSSSFTSQYKQVHSYLLSTQLTISSRWFATSGRKSPAFQLPGVPSLLGLYLLFVFKHTVPWGKRLCQFLIYPKVPQQPNSRKYALGCTHPWLGLADLRNRRQPRPLVIPSHPTTTPPPSPHHSPSTTPKYLPGQPSRSTHVSRRRRVEATCCSVMPQCCVHTIGSSAHAGRLAISSRTDCVTGNPHAW